MSRPRSSALQRWTLPGISIGYVHPGQKRADGSRPACITIAHRSLNRRIRITLDGIDFVPSNRQLALAKLKALVMPILYPDLTVEHESEVTLAPTLAEMQIEYVRVRGSDWTHNVQKLLSQSLTTFLTGYPINEPFDEGQFRQHIIARYRTIRTEKQLADSTLAKRMQYLSAFIGFCIRRRWMEENIITEIGIPALSESEDVEIYQWSALTRIIIYFRERAHDESQLRRNQRHNRLYAEYFHLLRLTGMRESEALKLRLCDIADDHFTIEGKRSRALKPRRRRFPLTLPGTVKGSPIWRWMMRIQLTFERIRRLIPAGGYRGGYLFPWQHGASVSQALVTAKTRLEIVDDLDVQAIRRTAIEMWESGLGIDWITACDLAGHSPAVRYHYYRKRERHREIAAALSRTARQSLANSSGETE